MIKVNKGLVEMHGTVSELLADIHLAVRSVCEKTDRSLVMAALLASTYQLEEVKTGKEKVDVKKSIENMKEDVNLALKYMQTFGGFHGDTYAEKDQTAKEIIKQLKESEEDEKDE